MQHISELTTEYLKRVTPVFKYNDKGEFYANIPISFDIETTSTYVDGDKVAFMYVWAISINGDCFYGRYWSEFTSFIKTLSRVWELDKKHKCIIYVHNLSYEFQFMRRHFEWQDVFAVDLRKPLKAVTHFIEFRDSYILSGLNLELTARNLTTHHIEKLVGDLDYDKIRHNTTPITDDEFNYIKNDVLIIINYIKEQIEEYGSIGKIPLTNTGRVRQFVRDKCFNVDGKRDNNKRKKYHEKMKQLQLTPHTYTQLRRGFMGGFTHASTYYSGKVVNDVHSIDFTSSYPSVMLVEQFPMSKPFPTTVDSLKELEELCEHYCVMFDVKFTNIRSNIYYENYISKSKCFNLQGEVINNGRVFKADVLETTITNVDYEIIKNTYDYDDIYVSNVHYFYKSYLPKPIIDSILELYQGKTELKGVAGKESEYLLSKGMLNSIYGMMVTDVARDLYNYEQDQWVVDDVDIHDNLKKHNASKNRFLYYAWGVWVTAYARLNLWSGIIAMGDDYIYSDTDSIKFKNYDKHKKYIEYYNQELIKKQQQVIEYYNLDAYLFKPKTVNGVEKLIGVWDYEGHYKRFKTLGAKRYLSEEQGELELTVAGLSKRQGLQYMKDKAGTNTGVFNMFNDSLYIPSGSTGKNTHTYIDDEKTVNITDYTGVTQTVYTRSNIHLEQVDFTLNISEVYRNFLKHLSHGLVIRG